MKLVIFGSTGGTGRELLKQALNEGHHVTAYARSPARIEDIKHASLKLVRGDVLDPAVVESTVAGHKAVLSTIGAGAGRTTLRQDGTRNIVEAMERTGVQRLICQSSLGIGDSRANLPFFTKYIIVSVFLRHAFADHERQEAIVKRTSLDWTIVRPPHLTNGLRTGVYRHGFPTMDTRIKGKISRADVADFMLRRFLSKKIPSCWSFCSASALPQQLHSSLCACCRALKPNKNPAQSGIFFSGNRLKQLTDDTYFHQTPGVSY